MLIFDKKKTPHHYWQGVSLRTKMFLHTFVSIVVSNIKLYFYITLADKRMQVQN